MKKIGVFQFILGIVIGVVVFGGSVAYATGITAQRSYQPMWIDRVPHDLTMYAIGGNNYVRLRDIGQAANFNVSYDVAADSVHISTTEPYSGGSTALAQILASATAEVSTQPIYVDGKLVSMTAYAIDGNNYVKLRDVAEAVGYDVEYDVSINAVYLTKGGTTTIAPVVTVADNTDTVSPVADGSGTLYDTPITSKILQGGDASREDFSQAANPAIFDSVYTRAAYNAVRQTVVDRDVIVAGNNDKGFNHHYSYAYTTASEETKSAIGSVLSLSGGGYYSYGAKHEPYATGMYVLGEAIYPGYFMVQVSNYTGTATELASNAIIAQANALASDADKVRLFNEYICDRLEYTRGNSNTSLTTVFTATSTAKAQGNCAVFNSAFRYLCDRAGIPCVEVTGENHAWSTVYVDGKWSIVDVSSNSLTASKTTYMLVDSFPKADEEPKLTAFAKELLVPSTTK